MAGTWEIVDFEPIITNEMFVRDIDKILWSDWMIN